MHGFTYSAIMAAVVAGVAAQDCSQDTLGNYYCEKVEKVVYTNVKASNPGSYNRVTNMDSNSGSCSSEPKDFAGPMKPLDEELSFHFRGPGQLKQFAVYYPSDDQVSKLKSRSPHSDHVKHGHQAFHKMMKEKRDAAPAPTEKVERRMDYDASGQPKWIEAVIDGKAVSWANSLFQGAPEATPAPAAPSQQESGSSAHADSVEDTNTTPNLGKLMPGDWVRHAYYDASSGVANGITFLNNMGGSSSGVFDMTFGNSLGYATSDGTGCAANSEVLEDTTIPSNSEVILFSGKKCQGDSCGYSRPGTVAYHGFGGAHKAFFMEFSMPKDGKTGFNADMPAAWFLNAQIPRTLQYGQADCSCWTSGCGEIDAFEVLASGEDRMKSTLHGYYDGGDSDYFARPTEGTMKAAVIFSNEEIHIQVLKGDHEFGNVQSSSTMETVCSIADDIESAIFSLITG